ncbi:MAG: cupin domain-containing protein [Chlamydiales bacterium]|nr:cupin domain-containing protein [Chlamydiales bacterium]
MNSHHFRLSQVAPQNKTAAGYRVIASKSNFPALQNMSLYKLVLEKQAVRAPHWHANADELGYCVEGKLLISIFATGNQKETFLVEEGDAFFIPSGALHSLENSGEDQAICILQFSNEEPEDFELSPAFNMFSNAVLGNTYGLEASVLSTIKRPLSNPVIAQVADKTSVENDNKYVSPYQYPLASSAPLISNSGGNAKVARNNVWPALTRQALYLLELTKTGMREPHWHPETAELGYIQSGKGRMSILSPSGAVDTYEMQAGDIYFIPKAYPHHIENLSNQESLNILIFFDQAMPKDIGFSASIKSFPDTVLAASLGISNDTLQQLPTTYEDAFIVTKRNTPDPTAST